MDISLSNNKDKIAVVVVGYNRLNSLTRLLNSLVNACYPNDSIPLVISIDASGDDKLYNYVKSFVWPHGEKYVIIQKERLGLKNHIFQCGDLTKFFKAIILLEDDLFVSPYFYDYVEKTVVKYGESDEIAEISLYKNETNGYAGLPFFNMQDGNDVFLMQDVSTWGQCWTEQMWNKFVEWRDCHTEEDIQNVDMPDRIKKWERAWSKYYIAYVINTRRYILYPNISLTTNFSDAGEHGDTQNSAVQVNLLQGRKHYYLEELSELTRYDIYNNNEAIYQWLGLKEDELCLDLYGNHINTGKKYLLSTRMFPYDIITSFALYMRPMELNIKYQLKGDGIFLYDTAGISKGNKGYSKRLIPYLIGTISLRLLVDYVIRTCTFFLKNKLKTIIK